MKRILFLTGTRADYGKIKSLLTKVKNDPSFELQIFVTGMHLLSQYGSTWKEIDKDGFNETFHYINQNRNTPMDLALSNTIEGISHYISENKPDLIIVHGDRVEALAGALAGALNNIRVAHIEGGEVSGTIDESIRHAITKLAHLHLVSNEESKKRIIQMGECEENVFIIGSPDIDIMFSSNLPSLEEVKEHYGIVNDDFSIFMYHPVTTEIDKLATNIEVVTNALIESQLNYIVIFPNNDLGSEIIINEYSKMKNNKKINIFPSVRFEYFLTLMKNAKFIIGNSSAGIREAHLFGVPAIDIGNRQKGRYSKEKLSSIAHVEEDRENLLAIINMVDTLNVENDSSFGEGDSADKFLRLLYSKKFWDVPIQKKFRDLS